MMMKRIDMVKVWICLAFMMSPSVWGSGNRFLVWHYEVESVNPKISHQACAHLLRLPYEYTLDADNKLVLRTQNPVQLSDAKLISKIWLRRHTYLFHISVDTEFEKNKIPENVEYVFNRSQHLIKGSFILSGFCKGQIVGVETHYE